MGGETKDGKNYTVEDVAKAANVSISTVSRVFSGAAKVNESTAAKVRKAAERFNYKPNRVARRLRGKNKQSMVIGLIITDLQNPFFSEIARGVEDVAYNNEHGVMVCNSDESLEKEQFYLNTLVSEQIAGLIIAPTIGGENHIRRIAEQGVPVVCVDRRLGDMNADSVTVENEDGAYRAVRRLLELGHRRIGIINGIKGISTTEQRFEGYRRALKEFDVKLEDDLVIYGNSKESGGREATRKLMALDKPPTSIFSTNNLMTLGCFEELYRQHISVPEQVAVIGFDDMSWASALNPPLTAIRQPGYELGAAAANLLLTRLAHPSRLVSQVVMKSELIIRESCGKPIK